MSNRLVSGRQQVRLRARGSSTSTPAQLDGPSGRLLPGRMGVQVSPRAPSWACSSAAERRSLKPRCAGSSPVGGTTRPLSSADQSTGLRTRVSGVRISQGVPRCASRTPAWPPKPAPPGSTPGRSTRPGVAQWQSCAHPTQGRGVRFSPPGPTPHIDSPYSVG